MSRIAFVTTITHPSKLANRIHVINMCNAFQIAGHKVTLFARQVTSTQSFPVVNVGKHNLYKSALRIYLKLRKEKDVLYYCREPRLFFVIFLLNFFDFRSSKINWIFEIHDEASSYYDKLAFFIVCNSARVIRIVVLNNALKNYLSNLKLKSSKSNILVVPDAVDLDTFKVLEKNKPTNEAYCAEGGPVVMYVGSMLEWKGIYVLAKAAKELPNVNFVFIGGRENELEEFDDWCTKENLQNIFTLGYKDNALVPGYLSTADILVLPNSSKLKVSQLYTSPLKLFEYMATKKPIVASDLPSLRDILTHEVNGLLFKADEPSDLVLQLKRLGDDSSFAKQLAENAYKDVQNYTWIKRVEKILETL